MACPSETFADEVCTKPLIKTGKIICKLPFVIDEPGYYVLKKNLKFPNKHCSNINGPLITIEANNVTLDGSQKQIIVDKQGTADAEVVVISIPGGNNIPYKFRNIVIKDLTIISNLPPTNFILGANAAGVEKLIFDNFDCINITSAIRITNIEDINVKNSLFRDTKAIFPNDFPFGAAIEVITNIISMRISNCNFEKLNPGSSTLQSGILARVNTSENTTQKVFVNNCLFNGCDTNVNFHTAIDVIVEDVEIFQTNTTFNALQFGFFFPESVVKNVTVRNIQISALNNPPQSAYAGVLLVNGTTALIENVILTTNAETTPGPDGELAEAILIGAAFLTGDPSIIFNNVLIKDVVIAGPNNIGINIDGSKNVTIKNSVINEANINILTLPGSSNIVIKDNEINGPALLPGDSIGISFTGTDQSTIYNNTITGNTTNGIVVDSTSNNNLIKENNLVANGVPQINNESATTVLENNTEVITASVNTKNKLHAKHKIKKHLI